MKIEIWEVNNKYFCPIAGFCLSGNEQVQIIRKFIIKKEQKLALKRLHETIIDCITEKSKAAKYIQKLLDKKYSDEISKIHNTTHKEWLKNIDTKLNWKDFGAFIWISARYMEFTDDEHSIIMDNSHLYSHEIYHQLRKSKAINTSLEAKNRQILEKYYDIKKQLKVLKNENKTEKGSNYQLQYKLNVLLKEQKENKQFDKNKFLTKICDLQQEVKRKEQNVLELVKTNKQLSRKVQKQTVFFVEIENDFKKILIELKNQNNACNTCNAVDLCQRKILIVGGITKMESYYRKLVNELGGHFLYHDGNSKQNRSGLINLVNKSDIVICPVDINSHFACLQVKKHCKKFNKNYYMLRKSSISSIYSTLKGIATD